MRGAIHIMNATLTSNYLRRQSLLLFWVAESLPPVAKVRSGSAVHLTAIPTTVQL